MTYPWEKYYTQAARDFDPDRIAARTIPAALAKSVEEFADRPALSTILPNGAETTISYRQLDEYSSSFACFLREELELAAGDTVALMAPNCIGFCVASLGIAKAGCIGTSVNPLYTAAELEHQLRDSRARAIAIIDLFGNKIDEVIANTSVERVITLSVVDFFPPVKKALLGFVLKRVRRVIPSMSTPVVTMLEALAIGARASASCDISAYVANIAPDDTAIYQYTSGTTGRSKGAELTHEGILINAAQGHVMTAHRMSGKGETALIALPLFHITAFTLLFLSGITSGSHGILIPSPRPPSNLKKAFQQHDITWFSGINTLFAALLVEPWFDRSLFASVRFSGSGGAAQQIGVAQKWKDQADMDICQGYGMTEVSGILTLTPPEENKLGLVGIPVPGAEVKCVDDNGNEVPRGERGEVIARTPAVMKGYLNNPEASNEVLKNGWYYSGDIGVMDEDGFLKIVDRKKDMILVSGFNVSPNEIENVISTLAGVAMVGVIGIDDEKTAEAPAAFVVRGDQDLTEADIIEQCRKHLTNYKIPRLVRFVDEVPVTLSGKVLRRQLREEYLASKTQR